MCSKPIALSATCRRCQHRPFRYRSRANRRRFNFLCTRIISVYIRRKLRRYLIMSIRINLKSQEPRIKSQENTIMAMNISIKKRQRLACYFGKLQYLTLFLFSLLSWFLALGSWLFPARAGLVLASFACHCYCYCHSTWFLVLKKLLNAQQH